MLSDDQRNELISNHIKLAYFVANKFYKTYWLKDDLYGEAMLALATAADKYDPSHNCKFITFAYKQIYWHLLNFSKREFMQNSCKSNTETRNRFRNKDYGSNKISLNQIETLELEDDSFSEEDIIKKMDLELMRKAIPIAIDNYTSKLRNVKVNHKQHTGYMIGQFLTGKSHKDISKDIGSSKQAVSQNFNNFKEELQKLIS